MFGFCFIRNHASSLVVDVFFFHGFFDKKKKVIKTTSKSVSFSLSVRAVVVIALVSVAVRFCLRLYVCSSSCQLLLVMCPCRMVLVRGLNPAENSVERKHSHLGRAPALPCCHWPGQKHASCHICKCLFLSQTCVR